MRGFALEVLEIGPGQIQAADESDNVVIGRSINNGKNEDIVFRKPPHIDIKLVIRMKWSHVGSLEVGRHEQCAGADHLQSEVEFIQHCDPKKSRVFAHNGENGVGRNLELGKGDG